MNQSQAAELGIERHAGFQIGHVQGDVGQGRLHGGSPGNAAQLRGAEVCWQSYPGVNTSAYGYYLLVFCAGHGGVRGVLVVVGYGARVAIAESRYLSGTCVNGGCVPKKLLVYGAHFEEEIRQAKCY